MCEGKQDSPVFQFNLLPKAHRLLPTASLVAAERSVKGKGKCQGQGSTIKT